VCTLRDRLGTTVLIPFLARLAACPGWLPHCT
jgi:hypothetical protein